MSEQDNTACILLASDDSDLRSSIESALTDNAINFALDHNGGKPGDCGFNQAARNTDVLIIPVSDDLELTTIQREQIFVGTISGIRNIVVLVDAAKVGSADEPKLSELNTSLTQLCSDLEERGSGSINHQVVAGIGQTVEGSGHPALGDYLSNASLVSLGDEKSLRLAVSSVADNGEITGTLLSGSVDKGDQVVLLPSAVRSHVENISADNTKIRLTLKDAVEIDPGNMICNANNPVEAADQFETTIIWCGEEPMIAGRHYDLRSTTNQVDATVTSLKYSINVDQEEPVAATKLEQNELGVCNISLSERIPFEHFDAAREASQFVLIDKDSGEEVGYGAIHFALRRASNVHWQALDVTRKRRAQQKGQRAAILWFTGLSGSGKSAIANIVDKKLVSQGRHTYTLDGDNVRHGLNRDLGFTDVDRVENIRRIGEVAKLMADSGLICLVSFISPFRSERQLARDLAEKDEFIEIHVDTPLEVAEARDVKGLYKKARAGEIKNFTGIDSPYEPPENPEIRVDTIEKSAEEAAEMILDKLQEWGVIVLR